MPTSNRRGRKFRGFAVLERPDGALVWGTFRPTEAEARATFEKWNPTNVGNVSRHVVVRVRVEIDEDMTAD